MKAITIILGAIMTFFGIYCMMSPGVTFMSIGWVLGGLVLLSGLNSVIQYFQMKKVAPVSGWELVSGICSILLGGLVLFNNKAAFFTDMVLIRVIGIWFLAIGIFRIVSSISIKQRNWGWSVAVGVLTVLAGIYSFIHPMVMAVSIGWCIAFVLLLQGISVILFGLSMGRQR